MNEEKEVLEAEIKQVSKLLMMGPGAEYLIVYIEINGITQRFFIFRNRVKNYCIVRYFEREIYSVGSKIRFKYKKSTKSNFNFITSMKDM